MNRQTDGFVPVGWVQRGSQALAMLEVLEVTEVTASVAFATLFTVIERGQVIGPWCHVRGQQRQGRQSCPAPHWPRSLH